MITVIKHLGEIAEVAAGQCAPQGSQWYGKEGRPFIRAGSLDFLCNGGSEKECECVSEQTAKMYGLRLFPQNTILFAKSGMSAKIGRVYRLKTDCYVVNHLAAIIPGKSIYPQFLERWLDKHPPSHLIPNDAYPSMRLSEIKNITICLPTLIKQKRIATILEKADSIVRKRQHAIALTDQFLRSEFIQIFGDPVLNPKAWIEKPLNSISQIVSGVTKGRRFNGNKTVSVPYMRVANVQDGFINLDDVQQIEALESEIKTFQLIEGDILLTEGGDPDKLGRGAVWKGQISPCIHQNHIFRVRVDRSIILPEYLSFLIGSQRGKRYFLQAAKQTTGVASINKTQLSRFPALVPPMEKQKAFLAILKKTEIIKNKLNLKLNLANNLFQSLSQRAFSGEL